MEKGMAPIRTLCCLPSFRLNLFNNGESMVSSDDVSDGKDGSLKEPSTRFDRAGETLREYQFLPTEYSTQCRYMF